MEEMPNAPIKDLLSSGYFSEELRDYSGAREIDLTSFNRQLLVPYLIRESESCRRSGQCDKSDILDFAIKFLLDINEDDIPHTLFGLKKFAAAEVNLNEQLCVTRPIGKSERLSCQRKSEAARALVKLLVSVIRVFKLAEVIAKGEESRDVRDSVVDAIDQNWQSSGLSSSYRQ